MPRSLPAFVLASFVAKAAFAAPAVPAPPSAPPAPPASDPGVGLPTPEAPKPRKPPPPSFDVNEDTPYGFAPYKPDDPNYGTQAFQIVDTETHQHDGFGLRLWTGPTFTQAAVDADSRRSRFRGLGLSIGGGFGGMVMDNFGASLESSITYVARPSDHSDRFPEPGYDSLTVLGFGVGFTYYFMPLNAYVTGSVLATQLRMNWDSTTPRPTETDYGFGIQAMVGKEFWVSRNWGLGAALLTRLSALEDTHYAGETQSWNAVGATLAFTASYN